MRRRRGCGPPVPGRVGAQNLMTESLLAAKVSDQSIVIQKMTVQLAPQSLELLAHRFVAV